MRDSTLLRRTRPHNTSVLVGHQQQLKTHQITLLQTVTAASWKIIRPWRCRIHVPGTTVSRTGLSPPRKASNSIGPMEVHRCVTTLHPFSLDRGCGAPSSCFKSSLVMDHLPVYLYYSKTYGKVIHDTGRIKRIRGRPLLPFRDCHCAATCNGPPPISTWHRRPSARCPCHRR